MFICCSDDPVVHLLQGSLDLRSSRALILSHISAGTGSVLRRCRPEGIWCDAAFRMIVRNLCSPYLAVGWKPSFAQLVLDLLTISVPVFLL